VRKRELVMASYIMVILTLSTVSLFNEIFPGVVLWLMTLFLLPFVFYEILAPLLKYSPRIASASSEKDGCLLENVLRGKLGVNDEKKLLKLIFQVE
jgi:hypothetical protein